MELTGQYTKQKRKNTCEEMKIEPNLKRMKQRRNALTRDEVTDLCIFSLKYHLTHPDLNGRIKLKEFVKLVNRFTTDDSLPIYLNTLVDCMLIKRKSDCERIDDSEYAVTLVTLLDVMEVYKKFVGDDFDSKMSAIKLYSFITNPNNHTLVEKHNKWEEMIYQGDEYDFNYQPGEESSYESSYESSQEINECVESECIESECIESECIESESIEDYELQVEFDEDELRLLRELLDDD